MLSVITLERNSLPLNLAFVCKLLLLISSVARCLAKCRCEFLRYFLYGEVDFVIVLQYIDFSWGFPLIILMVS